MQIVELLSVDPESKEVKVLYDVFSWGREALGEYIYFAEIDSKGYKDDGTGDLTKAEYHASVEVCFEDDVLEVAQNNIAKASALPIQPSINAIGNISPHELFQHHLGAEEFYIDSGSNHCFSMRLISSFQTVSFIKAETLENRTTTIRVSGKGTDISIGQMYETATRLINRYKAIPYNQFSGATRD